MENATPSCRLYCCMCNHAQSQCSSALHKPSNCCIYRVDISTEEVGTAVTSHTLYRSACDFGMIGMLIKSKPYLSQ